VLCTVLESQITRKGNGDDDGDSGGDGNGDGKRRKKKIRLKGLVVVRFRLERILQNGFAGGLAAVRWNIDDSDGGGRDGGGAEPIPYLVEVSRVEDALPARSKPYYDDRSSDENGDINDRIDQRLIDYYRSGDGGDGGGGTTGTTVIPAQFSSFEDGSYYDDTPWPRPISTGSYIGIDQ